MVQLWHRFMLAVKKLEADPRLALEFLDSGQDPEAALCSLHVFRPCGKHFNGGGLALAMICEGTASLDRAKDFAIFASVRAGLAELSPPPR